MASKNWRYDEFAIKCHMRGIPTVDMWIGTNGEYRVPAAISWLAKAADKVAGLPPAPYQTIEQRLSGPSFKVVEEWGRWRDGC